MSDSKEVHLLLRELFRKGSRGLTHYLLREDPRLLGKAGKNWLLRASALRLRQETPTQKQELLDEGVSHGDGEGRGGIQ